MKITLFDINEAVCDAWKREFSAYEDDVAIANVPLEEVPAADCIVAAGNSFGIMDGGLDAAMAQQFPECQKNVSDAIASDFVGEIPVGQSVIVVSGSDTFPWMAYTPTMRYPRPIAAEVVYDTMRASLIAVRQHNSQVMIDAIADLTEEELDEGKEPEIAEGMLIHSIAIPGLGLRTGNVGAQTGAKMMRFGYESIYVRKPEKYNNWDDVQDHLKRLYRTTGE